MGILGPDLLLGFDQRKGKRAGRFTRSSDDCFMHDCHERGGGGVMDAPQARDHGPRALHGEGPR